MAARIQDDFENGGRMFVIEIRGDIYTSNAITEALDEELHRFGSIDTLTYFRVNDTGAQRDLVERLGMDWDSRNMPWLLVLEDPPIEVREGDRAIRFELGHLNERDEVREVTQAIISASNDPDFVNDLTWERRKQRFLDMLPALKESAGLVVSIVGVV